MNTELQSLIRRDCYLLKDKYKKKFLLYFLLIIIVLALWYKLQEDAFLKESVIGITQQNFLDHPLYLPYTWFIFTFGFLVITHDYISEDLFYTFTNSIIKVKRMNFWFSKILTGFVGTAVVAIFHFIAVFLCRWMMLQKQVTSLLSVKILIKATLLNLCGMFLVFCVYSFLILYLNETVALLICFGLVFVGLPMYGAFVPLNHMMLQRTQLLYGGLYCVVVSMIFVFLGAFLIESIDLLHKEKRDGR